MSDSLHLSDYESSGTESNSSLPAPSFACNSSPINFDSEAYSLSSPDIDLTDDTLVDRKRRRSFENSRVAADTDGTDVGSEGSSTLVPLPISVTKKVFETRSDPSLSPVAVARKYRDVLRKRGAPLAWRAPQKQRARQKRVRRTDDEKKGFNSSSMVCVLVNIGGKLLFLRRRSFEVRHRRWNRRMPLRPAIYQ